MRVMAFKAQGGFTAYSINESGDNLPAELAPWTRTRLLNIDDLEMIRVIEQDGYYLVSST